MVYLKLFTAFISTGALSFVMFYVLMKQGNSESVTVIESKDKSGLKKMKAELKAEKFSWHKVVMSKWVAFGGGFYGVMAVLTYLVVEFREVVDFLTSEESVMATIAALGFGDLISFFINSLMNFIAAITWPVYWINKVEGQSIWVWFLVVYAGYVSGQFIAKNSRNPYAN
jgi:hypothetical protein